MTGVRECQPEAEPLRQHAPLPWRLAGKGTIRGAGNNSWVCSLNWRDRDGNAALLVEAVNSHAALQARVEELTKALEPFAKYELICVADAFVLKKFDFKDCLWVGGFSGPQPEYRHFDAARRAYSVSLEDRS